MLFRSLGAEDGLDGVEALGGEAEAVALGAKGKGGVVLEEEERDGGAEEGAREEERGDAGAGDKDWVAWRGHGGWATM